MTFDRIASVVAAVVVPLIGLALRSSRRNRLLTRIEEYRQLARRIRATDANAAGHLEEIVTDMVHALVRMEQRALRRKLDPGAVLALVFFTAPAAVGFVLALDWDSPWQLPVLILTAAWFLIWLVVGLTQLWGEGEEPQAGADPT